MTKISSSPLLTEPLLFFDSSVISFNMSIGYGASSESTLTVDLVDDCEDNPDATVRFQILKEPQNYGVGMPVYFPDNPQVMPNCKFGGILSNWTVKKSSGGKIYSVTVKDPRQLLENTLIIIDSMITGPIYHINYYNVYAYWEQNLLTAQDCSNYGLSGSNEKGMTYYGIIQTLSAMNINIYPSTYATYPFFYKIDFSTFPGISQTSRSLPLWYKVPGPGVSIMQLLEDICNVLAYDFYVYLEKINNIHYIKIGLIDLNYPPASFENILSSFSDQAVDISYGQEFRNEKSKMVILGDNVHYLMPSATIDFCFGTEPQTVGSVVVDVPVVPYGYDNCGFWINKNIQSLNVSLAYPFPSNGPYTISELDIRAAMSSYEMWIARAFDINVPGTLNATLRSMYPEAITNTQLILETFMSINAGNNNTLAMSKNFTDGLSNPSLSSVSKNYPIIVNDLKKIHTYLNNIGSTYYGKEFIVKLDRQKICKKYNPETNTFTYTDTPTNNGGWIDNTYNILGLYEPELSHFRLPDQRLTGFAKFELNYISQQLNTTMNSIVSGNNYSSRSSQFSNEPDLILGGS